MPSLYEIELTRRERQKRHFHILGHASSLFMLVLIASVLLAGCTEKEEPSWEGVRATYKQPILEHLGGQQ